MTNCTCTGATFRFIITRGQVGTSAPEMRKGLCCPNRSRECYEFRLRVNYPRRMLLVKEHRNFQILLARFQNLRVLFPFDSSISVEETRLCSIEIKRKKKKEKREIFISAYPRTTGNEYTGAKFCLHDLNFHSFDEMRADCKFFCEPLLRTKRRHG